MNQDLLKERLANHQYDNVFREIYIDAGQIPYQRDRYLRALSQFEVHFGQGDIVVFSAPGRSEIGGNHTDHQQGEVLAAAVNLDTIAMVRKTNDNYVYVLSDGYPMITVDLNFLDKKEEEQGTTKALIKGVLYEAKKRGYVVGGFETYITGDVLVGAGLSSSASFETLIGTIVSGLYNDMNIPQTEIACMGQCAENEYFGKPCGLMDQMACAVGGLVHIDFKDKGNPVVEGVDFDLNQHGYSLCIIDTKGSHADLTEDYAAVPGEMKAVAEIFGKHVLREVTKEDVFTSLNEIRRQLGDRAALRAIHFFEENERVREEVAALQSKNADRFLELVKASGDSSYKYLQNVYTNHDIEHQNVSIALAVSEIFLKQNGVARVHGGGFAGTIQAFVRDEAVESYQKIMEEIFGKGACQVLKIRKGGGIKVFG